MIYPARSIAFPDLQPKKGFTKQQHRELVERNCLALEHSIRARPRCLVQVQYANPTPIEPLVLTLIHETVKGEIPPTSLKIAAILVFEFRLNWISNDFKSSWGEICWYCGAQVFLVKYPCRLAQQDRHCGSELFSCRSFPTNRGWHLLLLYFNDQPTKEG